MTLWDFHLMIIFFFFNDTATTEIYTLSLHDALPILSGIQGDAWVVGNGADDVFQIHRGGGRGLRRAQHQRSALPFMRSEEHTSELQSQSNLVCRLLLEKHKIAPLVVLLVYHPSCSCD